MNELLILTKLDQINAKLDSLLHKPIAKSLKPYRVKLASRFTDHKPLTTEQIVSVYSDVELTPYILLKELRNQGIIAKSEQIWIKNSTKRVHRPLKLNSAN